MASPTNAEMVNTLILEQFAALGLSGMVSVTARLFRLEASIRSIAGPERTGWAQLACTLFGTGVLDRGSGFRQRPGRIDHIIEN